ncbi:MAG: hypothetical protein IJ513_01605, partial [Bacteroidaceae bacterium]|nr:hypothetical protein [Bacteroidaceae bacterium]
MEKEDIIKENIRRLGEISAVYNPVTGEGSTSVVRQWTTFEGFPVERINLPATMLSDEQIQQLSSMGAGRYLTDVMHTEASDRNIIRLWLKFCLKRIRHDFEYWARTMTTIADKGKGRDTAFT